MQNYKKNRIYTNKNKVFFQKQQRNNLQKAEINATIDFKVIFMRFKTLYHLKIIKSITQQKKVAEKRNLKYRV